MFLVWGIHQKAWKVFFSDVSIYWWLFLILVARHTTKLHKEEFILADGSEDTVYHDREGIATELHPIDVGRHVKLLAHISVDREAENALAGSRAAYHSPL